jgi:membrane associated rhomboid family serine protease
MLRDPRILAYQAVWFGVNLLFGLGAVSMPGLDGGAIAWEAHVGGFLAGLLAFSLFDPVRPPPPAQDRPPTMADDFPMTH